MNTRNRLQIIRCEISFDEARTRFPSIPPRILKSIYHYVEDKTPTGDFLKAVLSNDLFNAFGRADEENEKNLFNICIFIYNYIPTCCYGSLDKVLEWLKKED